MNNCENGTPDPLTGLCKFEHGVYLCDNGWTGPQCNECDNNYISNGTDCIFKECINGKTNPLTGKCTTYDSGQPKCDGNWSGDNCNQCTVHSF